MTTSWAASGTHVAGTTSVAAAYPTTGASVGDLYVYWVPWGNSTDDPPATPSGFTAPPNNVAIGGPAGESFGIDTGNRGISVFIREADGTETGTVTVNNGGSGSGRVIGGQISRLSKTEADWVVSVGKGSDNTRGTGYSATSDTNLGGVNGDVGVAATCWTPDNQNISVGPTLTWDGVADTTIQVQSVANTQGNDQRLLVYRRNLQGTNGSAPVYAATASGSVSGPTLFVRFHDETPATIPSGSATSSWSFSGSASGSSDRHGTATSGWSFAGSATGSSDRHGSATSAWSFTSGGASGTAPPNHGSATSEWSFASGGAAGHSDRHGSATSTWAFTGAAAGSNERHGSATGSWSFSGAATGHSERSGAASSSWTYSGTAAGHSERSGTASSSWSFTGSASGHAPAEGASGSATSEWSFTGSAVGSSDRHGTAASSWEFTSGGASGSSERHGSAVSGWEFAGSATGSSERHGSAVSDWTFTGSAAGSTQRSGSASSTWEFTSGGASGTAPAISIFDGEASGTLLPRGTSGTLRPRRISGRLSPAPITGRIEP